MAEAFRGGRVEDLPIPPMERALMMFIDLLTRHAWRITDRDVQDLRDVGWTDPQIAESVYIGSFFNMMVRIADAFGVLPPAVTDRDGIPAAIARVVEPA